MAKNDILAPYHAITTLGAILVIIISNKKTNLMKYALVNNQRVEAQKGMKGLCPVCKQPVLAKCGQYKVNHWAHSKSANCDKWWEPETGWHRDWKNLFPEEWQEVIAYNEKTGEKHVADIKTHQGFVIEFQHSHIKPEEQTSREEFYKNMIWIVDSTRLKKDFPRFLKAYYNQDIKYVNHKKNVFTLFHPERYLPKNWLNRNVPVFFDFKGTIELLDVGPEESEFRKELWCLFPLKMIRLNYYTDELPILIKSDKESIIQMINNYGYIHIDYQMIQNEIKQYLNIS